ncbi:MAG: hypothetical protein HY473_02445 [Candidatus Sungbacteria bacterium]|uniref:Homing endonuclease LAGLIDADG domain-containing protein n=1 Tax=Candidatus Sungiibacteriota bacterium TaxID=2750080 RepID=A0A932YZ21_9BACT|nr:hypothetical protein [Candidatus Sungbacteria bacterium]
MVQKEAERSQAIALRRQGLSYREILSQVPVAKSSLSLWLQSVGLSRKQRQRLSEKKRVAALRGAKKRKEQRLKLVEEIFASTRKDVNHISRRELWLMGVTLYWAEGSKEKDKRPGSGIRFSNSDPFMIKLFLKWLKEVAMVDKNSIYLDLYVHENSRNSVQDLLRFWSKVTGFPTSRLNHVYFKRSRVKTNRKNTGIGYYGLLNVRVRKSSYLQRQIAGWIRGINQYYWGVV